MGVEIQYGQVTGVHKQQDLFELATMGEDKIQARTVIIAAGSNPRKLQVPGEADLAGRGVSYCATCDGAFFKGRDVAVVGGGDSAVEESLYLTRFVNRVTIIHRRDELRATKHLQERAFADPRIEFLWNTEVEAIEGAQTVEQLQVRNNKTGAVTALPVSGVSSMWGCCRIPNSCRVL